MKQTKQNPDAGHDRYHHGNLRTGLLQAAHRQLKGDGIDSLSLRALARELGVSQTAPYRHFRDKDELLAAVACDGFHMLLKGPDSAPSLSWEQPDAGLLTLGLHYVSFARANGALYRLMFGPMLQRGKRYPELQAAGRAAWANLLLLVTEGVRLGMLRREDPVVLANTVWAGVHGLASLLLDRPGHFGDEPATQRQIELSLGSFIDGLRRPQS